MVVPDTAPILWALAAVVAIILILHRARRQIGRLLHWAGDRLGATRPELPAPAPTPPEGPSAQAKAARFVIDEISKTMTNAEIDREQGSYPHRDLAMEAARAAASAAEVITDSVARNAVRDWKDQWDHMYKAWRQKGGYDPMQWHPVKDAAKKATELLGELLRKG